MIPRRVALKQSAGGSSDPNWSSVTALIRANATSTEVNRIPLDTSANARAYTHQPTQRYGIYANHLGLKSPFTDGGGSMRNFASDQTRHTLTGATSTLSFGTADFTVEMWHYPTASGNYGLMQLSSTAGGLTTSASSFAVASYFLGFNGYLAGTTKTGTAGTMTQGAWNHIAISRTSGVTKVFIGGVQDMSFADTYSYVGPYLCVGAYYSTSNHMHGYLAGLRIVTGTGLYTANFTPPTTKPTAISGTQLLTNFDPIAADLSQLKQHIATCGYIETNAAASYHNTYEVFFANANNYQNIRMELGAHNNFGTAPFTIEGFFYVNEVSGGTHVIYKNTDETTDAVTTGVYLACNNRVLYIGLSSNGTAADIALSSTAGAFPDYAWNHLALVRDGNVFTIYVNGTSTWTTTSSAAIYYNSAQYPIVGGNNTAATGAMKNTFMDDFRITKGVARYTANFTPPTQAFPTS